METVLKVVLFVLFIYAMGVGFYRTYRLLNEKITGGRTLLEVLGYAALLVVANLLLFTAGIYFFLRLYEFLTLAD